MVSTPVEVFKLEPEGVRRHGQHFEDLVSGWYHFLANAVAGNRCDPAGLPVGCPYESSEFYRVRPARSQQIPTLRFQ